MDYRPYGYDLVMTIDALSGDNFIWTSTTSFQHLTALKWTCAGTDCNLTALDFANGCNIISQARFTLQ